LSYQHYSRRRIIDFVLAILYFRVLLTYSYRNDKHLLISCFPFPIILSETKRGIIMGKADLHIHTIYSWDGACAVEAILKQAADVAHLDVVAITDHDEIRGALKAEHLALQYGIEVIPGCEVSTTDGHLLALFVRARIPAGLSLRETVLLVQELGGICIVPHPEARATSSINRRVLRDALCDKAVAGTLLGVETFNAGLFDHAANNNAGKIADDLSLARVGASDAHLLWTIGHGVTLFPGRSANDLLNAIQNRQTIPSVIKKPASALILISWLRSYLLRRAGWVEYNRCRAAPIRLERIPSLARFTLAGE
jgi:predicted metal-dependent phosphoesterase TrpH